MWSRLDVRLAAGVLSHKLQTAACSFVTEPDNQLKDLWCFSPGVLELGVDSKQWEPADLGSGTLLSSHPASHIPLHLGIGLATTKWDADDD